MQAVDLTAENGQLHAASMTPKDEGQGVVHGCFKSWLFISGVCQCHLVSFAGREDQVRRSVQVSMSSGEFCWQGGSGAQICLGVSFDW